jgi:hypothetical protein
MCFLPGFADPHTPIPQVNIVTTASEMETKASAKKKVIIGGFADTERVGESKDFVIS